MNLVFPLDPVADNPRAVMRRRQKIDPVLGYGPVVDPSGAFEEVRISGACYTMLFNWVKADQRAQVNQRNRLPPAWALGIMHGAYRMDMADPATALGLQQISLGVSNPTNYFDLLNIITTCNPAPALYFSLGLSPFGMGGHIVGFKVTTTGGDYLDPASGLWRAFSRASLLWGVREKVKEYVDRMQRRCPTVEIELWAVEPD